MDGKFLDISLDYFSAQRGAVSAPVLIRRPYAFSSDRRLIAGIEAHEHANDSNGGA